MRNIDTKRKNKDESHTKGPNRVVLHGAEEHLEELVGGADAGVEVREVDASSGERDLRGLEVRMEVPHTQTIEINQSFLPSSF